VATDSITSLPAWAAQQIAALEAADTRAIALARGLSPAQLNWRPSNDRWSIGQCLQHLVMTNRVYLPPIARALEGQPVSVAVEAITPGWFGRWFIANYIEPSPRTRRSRAPAKARPSPQIEPAVLDQFLRSNDAARALVRRASTYDVNRIRFVNPFVSVIRFTVGTGLEIIWRHERRHLLQAERVAAMPDFPNPPPTSL